MQQPPVTSHQQVLQTSGLASNTDWFKSYANTLMQFIEALMSVEFDAKATLVHVAYVRGRKLLGLVQTLENSLRMWIASVGQFILGGDKAVLQHNQLLIKTMHDMIRIAQEPWITQGVTRGQAHAMLQSNQANFVLRNSSRAGFHAFDYMTQSDRVVHSMLLQQRKEDSDWNVDENGALRHVGSLGLIVRYTVTTIPKEILEKRENVANVFYNALKINERNDEYSAAQTLMDQVSTAWGTSLGQLFAPQATELKDAIAEFDQSALTYLSSLMINDPSMTASVKQTLAESADNVVAKSASLLQVTMSVEQQQPQQQQPQPPLLVMQQPYQQPQQQPPYQQYQQQPTPAFMQMTVS